jgi:hypothetical protein
MAAAVVSLGNTLPLDPTASDNQHDGAPPDPSFDADDRAHRHATHNAMNN